MATATPPEADLERGLRNGRLVGHYLRILGWSTLLNMALSLLAGNGLRLDFTFLIFLWVGGGLLRGKESFRKGAVVLLTIYAGAALVSLLLAFVVPGGSERFLDQTPDLAAFSLGAALVATGLPLALLMAPATRRAYRSGVPPAPPQPLALRTIYYVLGTIALASFPLMLDRVTDQAEPASRMTSRSWAPLSRGLSCVCFIRSEKTRGKRSPRRERLSRSPVTKVRGMTRGA